MALPVLNFPNIEFRFQKNEKDIVQLFDIIRKKFVDLTPEEYVRQRIVHFLINQINVPLSLIAIEKQLLFNGTKRRTDIVVYDTVLKPLLLVECKAPDVSINQQAIDQALRYNLALQVPYVFVSNGLTHCCLHLKNNERLILDRIPDYKDMLITS